MNRGIKRKLVGKINREMTNREIRNKQGNQLVNKLGNKREISGENEQGNDEQGYK